MKTKVENIDRYMKTLASGEARALILYKNTPGSEKSSETSHAIVALNKEGKIYYLDGQTGLSVDLRKDLQVQLAYRNFIEPGVKYD